MRDQARHYTHQLPRLTLADLKAMRRMFADGSTALQKETRVGVVRFIAEGTDYRAEIGGKVLQLRFCETAAGYGVRSWYCCPHCNSCRASLFVGAHDIACRECWGLNYASQSEGKLDRMRRRIRRMRADMWPDYEPAVSLFNHPFLFPKPKGMRWDTFTEKRAALVAYESAYWMAFRPVVDRITSMIERKTGKAAKGIGLIL
ncbi:hypothetical protein ACOY6S_18095 [Enterobacter bugandensis]|uniref:hypothetical protein n=1 Tax=Enterobacter bugandensis TaxID=881260 RepID=UPI003BE252E5